MCLGLFRGSVFGGVAWSAGGLLLWGKGKLMYEYYSFNLFLSFFFLSEQSMCVLLLIIGFTVGYGTMGAHDGRMCSCACGGE